MNFKPLSDYIEKVLIGEKGVPGCDVIIKKEHETLFRFSVGHSDYDRKIPVSSKDIYYMYSCTKPITCTAAMQLIEKGEFSLDTPVREILPAFADVFLMKDGVKIRPERTMTVRHLFTMSAGFDYNFNSEAIKEAVKNNPFAGTVEIVNSIAQMPLCFEPGEKFKYSLCHDVLAAVVETVSGMRFSEYLEKNIFSPLGMTDTGFILPENKKERISALYRCYERGKYESIPQSNMFQLSENYESGGAGLYSTVDDYILFAEAMANEGVGLSANKILKKESIDLMRTEQLSEYSVDSSFTCAAGPGYGYGLGVRTLIDKSGGQKSPLGEFGWDGAAGSYVLIDPTNKLSIFFSMHVMNWPMLIGCGHAPIRDLTYEILGL